LSTMESLESGRRRLTEELARPLINALRLDGVMTNELLLSAELEPEPSDWARFVAAATLAGLLRQKLGSTNSGIDATYLIDQIEELRRADPRLRPVVERLAEVLAIPAQTDRVVFPVALAHGPAPLSSFIGTVARWTDFDLRWVSDWHPADAATWARRGSIDPTRHGVHAFL
ncbi:MAG: hypothetical protein ACYDCQ_22525, partial [Dehalococcoidia bacterium]